MKINIHDLLPDKLPDESAYHLVTFFMDLAAVLESCYFDQMRRHIASTARSRLSYDLTNDFDDDLPF